MRRRWDQGRSRSPSTLSMRHGDLLDSSPFPLGGLATSARRPFYRALARRQPSARSPTDTRADALVRYFFARQVQLCSCTAYCLSCCRHLPSRTSPGRKTLLIRAWPRITRRPTVRALTRAEIAEYNRLRTGALSLSQTARAVRRAATSSRATATFASWSGQR